VKHPNQREVALDVPQESGPGHSSMLTTPPERLQPGSADLLAIDGAEKGSPWVRPCILIVESSAGRMDVRAPSVP
jgi:hypothetical protein